MANFFREFSDAEIADQALNSDGQAAIIFNNEFFGQNVSNSFWLKVTGVWKQCTTWLKISGVWTSVSPKIKVNGNW